MRRQLQQAVMGQRSTRGAFNAPAPMPGIVKKQPIPPFPVLPNGYIQIIAREKTADDQQPETTFMDRVTQLNLSKAADDILELTENIRSRQQKEIKVETVKKRAKYQNGSDSESVTSPISPEKRSANFQNESGPLKKVAKHGEESEEDVDWV